MENDRRKIANHIMVWSMVVIPVLGFFLGIASNGRSLKMYHIF